MASPPQFQAEDPTDEGFFDKLADDEFTVEGSRADSGDMVRDFPDLSLGDVGTSLEDSGDGFVAECRDQQQTSQVSKKELLVSEVGVPFECSRDQVVQSGGSAVNAMEAVSQVSSAGGGSRGASVKEIQWSAFNANLQQFDKGGFEPYSDFFADCADATADKMRDDVDPSFGFIENTGENPMTCVNSSEVVDTKSNVLDDNNAESWENYYPGWKYDAGTGQWYQVDGYDASTSPQLGGCNAATMDSQESVGEKAQVAALFISGSSDIVYLQQNTQSVLKTAEEDTTLTSVSNWNLDSQGSAVYPPTMVLDPQYPGWYYDTNTQQWYTLESYNQTLQMTSSTAQNQVIQDANNSAGVSEENLRLHDGDVLSEQNPIQRQDNQGFGGNWNALTSNYAQQNMWQPEEVGKIRQIEGFSENQQTSSFYGSALHGGSYTHQQTMLTTFQPVNSHNLGSNSVATSHSFIPEERMHHLDQPKVDQSLHTNLSTHCYGNQNSVNYSQQPLQGVGISYSHFTPHELRSSIGRPAHALVTFGFGGKLVIMKDTSFFGTNSDHGNQGTVGATISILSLSEVVKDKSNASSIVGGSSSDYFHALCEWSFPGPLVGGNATTKDINKWIDERIISCEYPGMDFHKDRYLRLLLSLLKISFQHYGKLRSPFGSDLSIEETDVPEMEVTKLLSSAKKNSAHFGESGSFTQCVQNLPSDKNIQETATEVQNLLVSGRRKEALQHAQEGQLWGPALVLAAQLGDKFYVDAVKKMAHCLFIPGSPLRTLSLLISGEPADVFSMHSWTPSLLGGIAAPQQSSQIQAISMLDDWEENLAIITANRTKDDELVMIHLGDCLWKEKGEVTAAHTCYLVAEANFEQYSDSARLCLIGADHWKYPRTYASPDAIQRTELYEYSKVLGNSQFVLLPFQPYKLIYAYMLAEVGKVSDSLRYCQASLKILKKSGRTPEVEMWRSLLSSLEEQLRTHQQSGYSTNLAAAKLVGKLFTSIDSTIHRMIGAPPPMPHSSVNDKEIYSAAPKVPNSQSTTEMSSLVPSTSVETMSAWIGDSSRKIMHNRSASEPDFGRSPQQDSGSVGAPGKESISGGSRFGRIGSQLLQKTMGWVSRSHRQARLGEQNKFYYDEKLKRWVEEGVELPAEEKPFKPPPKVASFQNCTPDYNISNAFKRGSLNPNEGTRVKSSVLLDNPEIPPLPPSQNQFSARGRMGVHSRYVDTFNRGGGAISNSFQSPAVASAKPPVSAKFFVPLPPATPDEQKTNRMGQNNQEATNHAETSTSVPNDASLSLPSSLHRFPSMDEIAPFRNKGSRAASCSENGPRSRTRRVSWSEMSTDVSNTQTTQRMSTGSSSCLSLQLNGGFYAGGLHEVEL